MVVGVIDTTDQKEKEVRLQEEQILHEKQLQENRNIIMALTIEYSAVYHVDIDTHIITPYTIDEQSRPAVEKAFKESDKYDDILVAYVDAYVYEPDREKFLRECSLESALADLNEGKTHIIKYRAVYNDEITFCELKFVASSKEQNRIKSVVIGFNNRDDEIMAQYINEKLIAEYISAFMVDLDTDKYRIYRHPDTTNVMDRADRIWSLAMEDFARECDADYYEIVKNIGTPDFLKKELADVDRREYTYRFPSANQPWRRSVVQVLDRTDGVPSNVVATFMGIDDYQSKINDQQKMLEVQQEQLKEALSMAQSANRAKTTFLNNMSHDIRTPMNAIIGFTTLATRHIDEKEKTIDYLGKIHQASDHLLSLINDVLDMSRIESGKMNLSEGPENLRAIVQNLKDIIQADVDAKQHEFFVNMENIENEYIICDKLRLNQVLLNVLSNSVKYTPNGGMIVLKVTEKELKKTGYATYEFHVRDNGMGMSEEFLEHVFEPFERVKNSTVSGIQGTGLGMSITKNLIDMMGGNIEIKSQLNKGTEINITFSFKVTDALGELETGKRDLTESNFIGKKILLAEDNVLNQEIATALLEEYGFLVEVVTDGHLAVERMKNAQDGDFDIILMDVQMPTMNGYEAARQIREMGTDISKIPIIAMTANAFEEDRKLALEAGMNDHISKPIDMEKLKTALSRYA